MRPAKCHDNKSLVYYTAPLSTSTEWRFEQHAIKFDEETSTDPTCYATFFRTDSDDGEAEESRMKGRKANKALKKHFSEKDV